MTEMPLRALSPGQPFRLPPPCGGEYRLVYANQCRALVEPLARRRHVIRTADGQVTEFDAPGGRQNWAPDTMVEVIEDSRNAVKAEIGVTPAQPSWTVTSKTPRRDAVGRPDITDPEVRDIAGLPPLPSAARIAGTPRPLDPATKRGQVVAMLRGGAAVKDVCARLGIKRGCALSHLSDARKFCGIQYEVRGETVAFI